MEHAKGLQLHNIATWDVRHLPRYKIFDLSMSAHETPRSSGGMHTLGGTR